MTDAEPAGLPCHLAGLSVLVTRPAEQAEGLCELIAAAHGRPIRFPTLEILGPADKHAARAMLGAARRAHLLVFVSSNAVQYAFPLLPDELPMDLEIAAIGQSTARALEAMGLPATLVPQRMDSEGLLALPLLEDMHGRRVIILRGNGGRELIAQTLRERGADVQQVEVYRRQLPARGGAARNLVTGWDRLVDAVVATSGAILDNLFTLVGEEGAGLVRKTPLIVVSQRLAEHALTLGCEAVHVASSARDHDVLAALCMVSEDVG
jgi:uroporphyrinogen-III synthase